MTDRFDASGLTAFAEALFAAAGLEPARRPPSPPTWSRPT